MENFTKLMQKADQVCKFLDLVPVENAEREEKYRDGKPISLDDVICG